MRWTHKEKKDLKISKRLLGTTSNMNSKKKLKLLLKRNKDLVRDLLLELEDVVLGQQIDEIQLDYEYRSKLARHRPNVQSI